MKVLSLTQPWATLVAIGAKRLETRSWHTPYRGPLAIHAAKGLAGMTTDDFDELCNDSPFADALGPALYEGLWQPGEYIEPRLLPRGAIVAVCELTGCFGTPTAGAPYRAYFGGQCIPPNEQERAFGNYEPGRFAWRLDNVRRLAVPIPARGQLGLWEFDVPESALLTAAVT